MSVIHGPVLSKVDANQYGNATRAQIMSGCFYHHTTRDSVCMTTEHLQKFSFDPQKVDAEFNGFVVEFQRQELITNIITGIVEYLYLSEVSYITVK